MKPALPEVVWSAHSLRRAHERFGDCTQLTFPDALIQCVAMCKEPGGEFVVAQGGVAYACVRHQTANAVIIKTVYSPGDRDHAKGGNRKIVHSATGSSALKRRMDKREQQTRRQQRQSWAEEQGD